MKSLIKMSLRVSILILVLSLLCGEAYAQISVRPKPRSSSSAPQSSAGKPQTSAKPNKNTVKPVAKGGAKTPPAAQQTMPAPMKRTPGPAVGKRKADKAEAQQSEKSVRLQAFDAYQRRDEKESSWQRVVYRELDVMAGGNASLYYPQEPMDGLTNFFRVIMDLVASGQVTGYEYLDGREVFTEKYAIKVKDMLDKFQVLYTVKPTPGKNRQPLFVIEEADVPCNEVLSYYIKERWEFDHRTSKYAPRILAICPVLHRSGDWGGEAVKYPMFWLRYEDLRPYLRKQLIMSDGMNNAPRYTMEDFFTLEQYTGEIYKVQNVRGQTLMQQYPNADSLKMARQKLEAELRGFGDSIWVKEPVEPEPVAKKAKTRTTRVAASSDKKSAASSSKRNRRTKEAVDVEAANAEKEAEATALEEKAQKTGAARSVRRTR